jgi:hypothetical protein
VNPSCSQWTISRTLGNLKSKSILTCTAFLVTYLVRLLLSRLLDRNNSLDPHPKLCWVA